MIGHDDHAVRGGCGLDSILSDEFPASRDRQSGHKRIAERNLGPPGPQLVYDVERGRFPDIIYVPFVCYSEDVNVGVPYRLRMVVQRSLDLLHNEIRHVAIDISGQLDEAGFQAGLFGFPGEVERIDRDAMTAKTRTRIERHEAKG